MTNLERRTIENECAYEVIGFIESQIELAQIMLDNSIRALNPEEVEILKTRIDTYNYIKDGVDTDFEDF